MLINMVAAMTVVDSSSSSSLLSSTTTTSTTTTIYLNYDFQKTAPLSNITNTAVYVFSDRHPTSGRIDGKETEIT